MIIKDTIRLLLKKGFNYLGCNQPDIAIFFKPINSERISVCILSDHTSSNKYSSEQLISILNEVERKFIFNGYRDIQCHFIIFTNNIERDRNLTNSTMSFWLVDTAIKRLIIYDEQPLDFENIKDDIENLLAKPEEKKKSRFMSLPFVTFNIIGINVLIHLLLEFNGSTLDSLYMANRGASSWQLIFNNGEYYRLVTSMFMHFGGEHLINNMITLAVVGNEVEHIIGHSKFIVIYLLSGLGAGLMSAVYNMNINPDQFIISAGASGAIFGIIGALLVVSLLYRSVRQVIRPANLAIIIALSIFNGFMNFQIDNMAHIGGLMFGIIIAFISCLCTKSVIK